MCVVSRALGWQQVGKRLVGALPAGLTYFPQILHGYSSASNGDWEEPHEALLCTTDPLLIASWAKQCRSQNASLLYPLGGLREMKITGFRSESVLTWVDCGSRFQLRRK